MGLIDPHTHTAFLSWHDIKLMSEAGYEAVATLAYIPVRPSSTATLEDHFKHLLIEVDRLKTLGIRGIVGVGIHPRCLIPERIDESLRLVSEYLPKADLLAEVGVEDPNSRAEELILRKQLGIGKELGKPVIVHTPRKLKAEAVKVIVKALKDVRYPEDLVVIDHVIPSKEVLEALSNSNYFIGLTIQPGKAWIQDVEYLLNTSEDLIDRLMINSDAGRDPSNPLAVAEAYGILSRKGYPSEAYRLTSLNAREFLKLMVR